MPTAPTLAASAISATQINLSWTRNSGNERQFRIERRTGTSGTWELLTNVGSGSISYSNTGLSANTQYFYRVRASNPAGNSSWSNEANATTAAHVDVPTAPSTLAAIAISATQINLSWTDNSANEAGFRIERRTGSIGNWVQIATVGANATSFSNTGLSASTQYFYRVRATNSGGDSAFSNEANSTTQGAPEQ